MRGTEKCAKIALIGLAVAGLSGLAWAQAPKTPADAIEFRQQQMKSLGGAFKAVNDEVRGTSPNLDTIRSNTQTMQKLAAELSTWFPAGSGPDAGVKTTAKAEIWTNHPGFEGKVKALQAAVQGLATAGVGTDPAAVATAARAIGQACQGCHSEFRVRPAAPPPAAPPAPPAT